MFIWLAELKKYIPLLRELVIRDLKIKYRRSFLGYIWSLMNPLLMMSILIFVFSNVFRFDIANYPLYLITGQIIFNFISEATTSSMFSIIVNAELLKKVYVPKLIFPLSRVISCFITMLFSMLAILIVMVLTDSPINYTLLLIPIPIFFLFVFSLGISMILAAVTVYFRDMVHLYTVFITAWSFLTPIFYPISIVPDKFQQYLLLNPLYYFLDYFRQLIIYQNVPGFNLMGMCIFLSLGAFIIGLIFFKKLQKNFLLYI